MIQIDLEKCIGCTLCIKDCFPNNIELIDNKAVIKSETCMHCGHCIAVCPQNAVSTTNYDMNDVIEYKSEDFSVDAEHLLNFIKFRRTVRQFENKDVQKEKIMKIIEAGRFTQTGSNSQKVSYTVVKENLQALKTMTIETLGNMGNEILSNPTLKNSPFQGYAQLFVHLHQAYKANPLENDRLFFNAPAVIIVASRSPVDGVLASSNMELMTNALGLGTFFSGFFVKAAQENPDIKKLLGIKKGYEIATCMVIGYPKVKYVRTVPRKKADISWK